MARAVIVSREGGVNSKECLHDFQMSSFTVLLYMPSTVVPNFYSKRERHIHMYTTPLYIHINIIVAHCTEYNEYSGLSWFGLVCFHST